FFIVTHRSHGMEKNIFSDVNAHADRDSKISRKMFKKVLNVPDQLYYEYSRGDYMVKSGSDERRGKHLMQPYMMWKGMISKKYGCQVLIDDRPELVKDGCLRYGIDFIDIDDFHYQP
ncbi:MAG: hypothetical protein WC284_19100, partial [Candidimonas sp.]